MSVRFDAVADWLTTSTVPSTTTGFTLEAFFKISVDTNVETCLMALESSIGAGYIAAATDSTGTALWIITNGTLGFNVSSTISLVVGKNYYIALTHDSTTASLHVYDADFPDTAVQTVTLTIGIQTSLDIISWGNNFYGWVLNGTISRPMAYENVALSAAQVKTQMGTKSVANATGLWARWAFTTNSSGDRTTDLTGNGHTLINPGSAGVWQTEADPPIGLSIYPRTIPLALNDNVAIPVVTGGNPYYTSVIGAYEDEVIGTQWFDESLNTEGYFDEAMAKLSATGLYFQNLAGSLAPAGALIKQARKILAGSVTATGALLKTTTKILAGAFGASGALVNAFTRLLSLSGSIIPAGALQKRTNKVLSGSSTLAGALIKTTTKILSGSVALAGALLKTVSKIFSGSVSMSGALLKMTTKVLSGSSTLSGALSALKLALKILGGSFTVSGDLQKQANKVLAGSSALSGALLKQTTKILAGVVSMSGALVRAFTHFMNLTASFTPVGTVVKVTTKVVSGSSTLAGALQKQARKVLAGSVSLSGALQRQIAKVLSGLVSMAGTLLKTTTKILSGAFTATGTVFGNFILVKILAGSLSVTGGLLKTTIKQVAGAVGLVGTLVRSTSKLLNGTISITGALARSFLFRLSGSVTVAGGLIKQATKRFSGTLSPSGAMARLPTKVLGGSVGAVGTIVRSTSKILSGVSSLAGSISKTTFKRLSGVLSVVAFLATQLIGAPIVFTQFVGATLNLSGGMQKTAIKRLGGAVSLFGSIIWGGVKGFFARLEATPAIQALLSLVSGPTSSLTLMETPAQALIQIDEPKASLSSSTEYIASVKLAETPFAKITGGNVLSLKENNNEDVECKVKSRAGAIWNLTGWTLFEFKVTENDDGSGTVLFSKSSATPSEITVTDAANGIVMVYVLPSDTNNKVGTYFYELKGTDALGKKFTLSGPSPIAVTKTII